MPREKDAPDIMALTEQLLSKAGSSLVQPGGAAGFEGESLPQSQYNAVRVPTVEECMVPPPPMSPYASVRGKGGG